VKEGAHHSPVRNTFVRLMGKRLVGDLE